MMRSSNPALTDQTFTGFGFAKEASDVMTVRGVVMKTALSLLLLMLSAGWTYSLFVRSGGNAAAVAPWMTIGLLGGLGLAIATVIKKVWAPVTTPLYAVMEGLFLGGISGVLEHSFPGIALQAASLTCATLFSMLAVYQMGLIRATEKFKLGVIAATGAIAIVYFVSIILSFFSVSIPFIYSSGLIGIGFSLVVVVIAALNFIIDFDFIEQGVRWGAPRYMEWYGSFALMVTLIWLYVEFLRLLSKLRSSR